jgi:SPP1 gp7 family putative phage head morphogenesis protein
MPKIDPFGIKAKSSIRFLRDRLGISEAEWAAILAGADAAAAAAIDDQRDAMARDFTKAIIEILESGGTVRDFQNDYGEIVDRYGWSPDGDPGWHSELIFRMQTANARAAGWWKQAQKLKSVRPFVRYLTVGDRRVRHTHREWHNVILPVDHPFWRTHWPPNGFGCRCMVRTVSERELKLYGWKITKDGFSGLAIPPDKGFAGNVGLAMAQVRARGQN